MTTPQTAAVLPETQALKLERHGAILTVLLNRPESRNAMSQQLVNELGNVFAAIASDLSIRGVVLRGAGGHFCAGADIKDMAGLRVQYQEQGLEVYSKFNRTFGTLIDLVNQAPQTVVAVLEGVVLGGGFGLACVSDVALCLSSAQFGLPETGLGVIPAQIAPFVVQRIGLTQARRLALLGNRFNGHEAVRINLAHQVAETHEELEVQLETVLAQIRRAAPSASRVTKALLHRVGTEPLHQLLDLAAQQFAEASVNEGLEGTMAFVQKRLPNWAE
jgi:isohexenylglutaconyl-CoA hydratase